MTDSGTVSPGERVTFLPAAIVTQLRTEGRKYATIERARSKKQFFFGRLANEAWVQIQLDGLDEEVTKDDLLMEMSWYVNSVSDFPVVSESGETLRRWAEVAAFFENVPAVEEMQKLLSFDHFFRAKKLYYGGWVDAADAPLAAAIAQKLTGEEMTRLFEDPPQVDPAVLEMRQHYPEWAWTAAYRLLSCNGEREQAEYHLKEYCRIVGRK